MIFDPSPDADNAAVGSHTDGSEICVGYISVLLFQKRRLQSADGRGAPEVCISAMGTRVSG